MADFGEFLGKVGGVAKDVGLGMFNASKAGDRLRRQRLLEEQIELEREALEQRQAASRLGAIAQTLPPESFRKVAAESPDLVGERTSQILGELGELDSALTQRLAIIALLPEDQRPGIRKEHQKRFNALLGMDEGSLQQIAFGSPATIGNVMAARAGGLPEDPMRVAQRRTYEQLIERGLTPSEALEHLSKLEGLRSFPFLSPQRIPGTTSGIVPEPPPMVLPGGATATPGINPNATDPRFLGRGGRGMTERGAAIAEGFRANSGAPYTLSQYLRDMEQIEDPNISAATKQMAILSAINNLPRLVNETGDPFTAQQIAQEQQRLRDFLFRVEQGTEATQPIGALGESTRGLDKRKDR